MLSLPSLLIGLMHLLSRRRGRNVLQLRLARKYRGKLGRGCCLLVMDLVMYGSEAVDSMLANYGVGLVVESRWVSIPMSVREVELYIDVEQ